MGFFWIIYFVNNTLQFIFYISSINNYVLYFINLRISYIASIMIVLIFTVIIYKIPEFRYFYIYSKIEINKFTWLSLKNTLSISYNIVFFILFIILALFFLDL